MTHKPKHLFNAILSAGLLVGTLDISAAIIQTLINKRDVVKLFQSLRVVFLVPLNHFPGD